MGRQELVQGPLCSLKVKDALKGNGNPGEFSFGNGV